jgi:lipopolysaccharide assembly protein A
MNCLLACDRRPSRFIPGHIGNFRPTPWIEQEALCRRYPSDGIQVGIDSTAKLVNGIEDANRWLEEGMPGSKASPNVVVAKEDPSMRGFYFLLLVALLGAITIFGLQNQHEITLRYLDQSVTCELSLLIAIVYFLGMLTGWTFIGVVRRSLRRVSERPHR